MKTNIKYLSIAIIVFVSGYLFRKFELIKYFKPNANIVFLDNTVKDFGDLNEGGKAVHYFKFKNSGSKDLVIENIETRCGCTIPEWPMEGIKPGETDSIRVEYDTHIIGPFNRSIAIYANTESKIDYVHIKGIVKD